jgi:hypothetical protein
MWHRKDFIVIFVGLDIDKLTSMSNPYNSTHEMEFCIINLNHSCFYFLTATSMESWVAMKYLVGLSLGSLRYTISSVFDSSLRKSNSTIWIFIIWKYFGWEEWWTSGLIWQRQDSDRLKFNLILACNRRRSLSCRW